MPKQGIEKEETAKKHPWFTKDQLLQAKAYRDRRDLVSALVTETERITKDELERRIQTFLRKKVD
ncbi:MAG: hypothetical protein KHZ62_09600 [Clostridiales bacterium]|nr:hypothetical protein [Clostridiales bacterium]